MITLGAGVGGGIILDGEIYRGKGIGGSELGHMVIVENGEPCTCGRRGCLETYVSVTALRRAGQQASGEALSPAEIFGRAKQGDDALKPVADSYIRRLGTGIVNIVNIFRPELILIGGELSDQGEMLIPPLYDIMKKGCFGGEKGALPEIDRAALGREAGMIGAANLV